MAKRPKRGSDVRAAKAAEATHFTEALSKFVSETEKNLPRAKRLGRTPIGAAPTSLTAAETMKSTPSKKAQSRKAVHYGTLAKRQGDKLASGGRPLTVDKPAVQVRCRLPKSMHSDLKRLALDRNTTIQALLIEATYDVLRKYR